MGTLEYILWYCISITSLQAIKMFAIIKFTFFNVILGLADVLTDLATFFFLLEEGHVTWAFLTAQWMVTPFIVEAFNFLVR